MPGHIGHHSRVGQLLSAVALAGLCAACAIDAPVGPKTEMAPTEETAADLVSTSATGWSVRTIPLLPGGTWSQATAINDQHDIVGFGNVAGGAIHAFKFANGVLTDLGASKSLGNSWAYGMNEVGDIVGAATDFGKSTQPHPIRWLANGTFVKLPGLGRAGVGRALDINDGGVAVGTGLRGDGVWRPVRYSPTGAKELPTQDLDPDKNCVGYAGEARAINNAGEMVGFADFYGYRWNAAGTTSDCLFFYDTEGLTWGTVRTRYYDITDNGITAAWIVLAPFVGDPNAMSFEGVITSQNDLWGG